MNIGPFQIFVLAFVILVLFGRGRISEMMGDFGKGVTSFRRGVTEDEKPMRSALDANKLIPAPGETEEVNSPGTGRR